MNKFLLGCAFAAICVAAWPSLKEELNYRIDQMGEVFNPNPN